MSVNFLESSIVFDISSCSTVFDKCFCDVDVTEAIGKMTWASLETFSVLQIDLRATIHPMSNSIMQNYFSLPPSAGRKTLYMQYLWHSIKLLVVILCFSAIVIYFHLWQHEQSSSCCTCDWGLILKPPTQENSPFSVDSQPKPRLSSLNRFALLQLAALLPPSCWAPARF